MTNSEFQACLEYLGLSQTDAAQLLSVNPRTVRRWAEEQCNIPGHVEQVLRAWKRLHESNIPWRPDGVDVVENDSCELARQIALHRDHAIELDAVIQRVKARGGPSAPWDVDLKKRRATLGPVWVSFYPLRNGSFSPQQYGRRDTRPDIERNRLLLEDAYVCIAFAIGKAGQDWAI